MHVVAFEHAMSASCARSIAKLNAWRSGLPAAPANGLTGLPAQSLDLWLASHMLYPSQVVRAAGCSVSCCFSCGSELYRMTSSGVRLWLAKPIRLSPLDSYLVSCAF